MAARDSFPCGEISFCRHPTQFCKNGICRNCRDYLQTCSTGHHTSNCSKVCQDSKTTTPTQGTFSAESTTVASYTSRNLTRNPTTAFTTPTTTISNGIDPGHGTGTWVAIGSVGGLLVLFIIALLVYVILKRRSRGRNNEDETDVGVGTIPSAGQDMQLTQATGAELQNGAAGQEETGPLLHHGSSEDLPAAANGYQDVRGELSIPFAPGHTRPNADVAPGDESIRIIREQHLRKLEV